MFNWSFLKRLTILGLIIGLGVALAFFGQKTLANNGTSTPVSASRTNSAIVAQDKPKESQPQAENNGKPNVVMLMSDDVGWGDYGVYYGGQALGHPTPNIDRLAKEGAMFTSWYGQASCTAGRASFMTGRIPVREPPIPMGLDSRQAAAN